MHLKWSKYINLILTNTFNTMITISVMSTQTTNTLTMKTLLTLPQEIRLLKLTIHSEQEAVNLQ